MICFVCIFRFTCFPKKTDFFINQIHKLKDDKDEIKPLYRSRDWMRDERKQNKKERKTNWYKNNENIKNRNNYESVLFVPVTKGGILAKELKKREEELNRNKNKRIKIVESGGIKLKDILVDKNPFENAKCKETKCFVCKSEESEVPTFLCSTSNCGYRLICTTCKDRNLTKIYEGETSRSARLRGKEHQAGLKNKNLNTNINSLITLMKKWNLRWRSQRFLKTPSLDRPMRRSGSAAERKVNY